MWRRWLRNPRRLQGKLAFAVRAEKRERTFKRSIAAVTALVIVAFVAGTAPGRRGVRSPPGASACVPRSDRGAAARSGWNGSKYTRKRLRNAGQRAAVPGEDGAPGSAMDEFLRAASMDARRAVIRWGNVDRSIVLSSAVFEPDDDRSYRLKPGVRSVWVIGLSPGEQPGDVPGAR